MGRKNRQLFRIMFASIFAAGLVTTNSLKVSAPKDPHQLGFPFYVMIERRFHGVGPPLRMATIILSKEYFSKENLERLFLWYSKNNRYRGERLTVQVYTDPTKIKPVRMYTPIATQAVEKESSEPATLADATFFRTIPSASSHGAGENEFFMYDPMMSGNTGQRRVVLKGIDPYAIKKNLGVWETRVKDVNLRISAYELPSVEPSRTYYSLQSRERGSEYWETIMTCQQDGTLRIPSDQVRFLTSKIVYAFMGSLFAVTKDGGAEWAVWDSERDVSCKKGWATAMIRVVQIQRSGFGIMSVQLAGESRTLEMRTNDFGALWNCN